VSIFITGGTGYLGSYVLTELLEQPEAGRLKLMTRAADRGEAVAKLWRALQLHMDADRFRAALERIDFVPGDLHAPGLGIDEKDREAILEECDSVLHIAASLNRKSSKACFNSNLRGTLSVIELTREIAERQGGLRRFSEVSTTAVAGKREHECVTEDEAIDWDRSDYDPYARTKKFGEHMVHELLPDVPKTIFRPPTVMGDSRFARTTQFDMVRIYCLMIDAPVVPVHPDTRLDFVPADFVGHCIARLHMKERPAHETYHLSAGLGSKTAREHAETLRAAGIRTPILAPRLHGAFDRISDQLASGPRGQVSLIGSLIKVFLPYFTNDVVFDNTRVTEELGVTPAPFTDYAVDLYRWAKSVRFSYPYAPLPERAMIQEAAE
jgi:nucleoside-diphosphate-sugar epimerase